MVSRISELGLNCPDPELLAGFWCKVLGYVEFDREDGAMMPGVVTESLSTVGQGTGGGASVEQRGLGVCAQCHGPP